MADTSQQLAVHPQEKVAVRTCLTHLDKAICQQRKVYTDVSTVYRESLRECTKLHGHPQMPERQVESSVTALPVWMSGEYGMGAPLDGNKEKAITIAAKWYSPQAMCYSDGQGRAGKKPGL